MNFSAKEHRLLAKNEFLVLCASLTYPHESQRTIATHVDISLGSVNQSIKTLQSKGLLCNGTVTDAGMTALAPYKVKNAIIMAAGLSSRFAPISYEKPKGLLRVRGEILIERQIEQLREAGICSITVVVGYKKEFFFYLEDKYGVEIVINPEYATRNNHSTLMVVRNKLSNTYICSSDDYFAENPFEPYVYQAYYAAQYCKGETPEWCIKEGPNKRIMGVTIGGKDSLIMLGHVYFDQKFSSRFVEILKDEYSLPETADKLWEQLYIDHIKELDMTVKQYPDGMINEFDSLDELRAFDPEFMVNVDSEVFDNIVKTLGCAREEIHNVYPLKQGLTNLSCHFAINAGEYVYRHPGTGTDKLIDRTEESKAQCWAKELEIDDTFIYEDPERGWKISRFIPDCRQLDVRNKDDLKAAASLIRQLHCSKAELTLEFDFFKKSEEYASLMVPEELDAIPSFRNVEARVAELHELFESDGIGFTCLCHNDFFPLNLLKDKNERISLIDWEYAGMADYSQDIGTFIVCGELDDSTADEMISYYCGETPNIAKLRHFYASVAFAGWCWYVWSLYKESQGESVGEWLYIYYRYAKRYLKKALGLYEADAE